MTRGFMEEKDHAREGVHPGVPDFLDSRLKHAGMTRGTVVNSNIRTECSLTNSGGQHAPGT